MRIRSAFLTLIAVAAGACTALVACLGLYANAGKKIESAYKQQYESYLLADELRQSSDDLTRLVRTYVATGSASYKDQYQAVLDIRGGKQPTPQAYHRIYWDFVAGGQATPRPAGETASLLDRMKRAGFTAGELKLLDDAAAKSNGLVGLETEAMTLVGGASATPENRNRATQLVNSAEYHRFKAEIMRPIDEFYVLLETRLANAVTAAANEAGFYWSAVLVSGGALILVLGVFAMVMFSRVINSIGDLRLAMSEIAALRLDHTIPGLARKDEFGEMANALEMFRKGAIANQDLEREAEAMRRHSEEERERLTAEAERAAQVRLNEATAGLAIGLRRLAQGDLSFSLSDEFAPDFEALRHDLNAAVGQLAQTMKGVMNASQTMHSGTTEISQAADDLSRRTEQQAASLEETAAALEQITSTVRRTAEGVQHARSVASNAKSDAERSGAVVKEAIGAMAAIERSSKEISQIIGVIDEIAFQTNLLALNAGVEAARAGDAGRGFAVVAQEVRALAQRSAEAAKEIKTLISASSEQVGRGVSLVGETGQSLERIVVQVVEINEVITEISASTQEQATGLSEINTAVNQMDQATQQNAAMVEQSTAASHSLAGEASELSRLVTQFRLVSSAAHGASPGRPAASPAKTVSALKTVGGRGSSAARKPQPDSWEEF